MSMVGGGVDIGLQTGDMATAVNHAVRPPTSGISAGISVTRRTLEEGTTANPEPAFCDHQPIVLQ